MARARWIGVPDLRQKLDLLVDSRLVPSKIALAEEWNVGRSTLYNWERSSDGKRENRLPAEMFVRMQAKFEPLLAHLSAREIGDYMRGPARLLVDEIARSKVLDRSLTGFLEDAVRGEGRVIKAPRDLPLVAIASTPDDTVPQVRLGELFRLEFTLRHRCRYAIAIQNVGRSWGIVPALVDERSNLVLSPGPSVSGEQAYLHESVEPGLHSFYCLQSVAAVSGDLQTRLAEPFELDRGAMAAMGQFYGEQARRDRALQRIDLRVSRG